MESMPFILPPLSMEECINSAIQIIIDFISGNVKTNSVMHNPSERKVNHHQLFDLKSIKNEN